MTRFLLSWCALLLPAAVAVAACSSSSKGSATFTGGTGGAGGSAASGPSSGAGGDGGLLGDAFATVGVGGGSGTGGGDAGAPYLIYADTDTTLFSLDPNAPNLALTEVGTFDCVGPYGTPGAQTTAMTDLAVDRNQNVYALSSYAVRQVDLPTGGSADAGSADGGAIVHCHPDISLHVPDPSSTDPSFPYIKFEALSFAPVGVIDPSREMLVAGNTAGQLWVIDPSTAPATITQHGAFGTVPHDDGHGHDYMYPGGLWELSGDIVFLANNGSPVGFATVRDCPNPPDNTGCNYNDTLIEIDMTALGKAGTQSVLKTIRGMIVEGSSCGGNGGNGFGSLFGIASWNAQVYGFSRSGNLVNISNVDATACLVQNYPMDLFSGAAVTTVAPVKPPPVN